MKIQDIVTASHTEFREKVVCKYMELVCVSIHIYQLTNDLLHDPL